MPNERPGNRQFQSMAEALEALAPFLPGDKAWMLEALREMAGRHGGVKCEFLAPDHAFLNIHHVIGGDPAEWKWTKEWDGVYYRLPEEWIDPVEWRLRNV